MKKTSLVRAPKIWIALVALSTVALSLSSGCGGTATPPKDAGRDVKTDMAVGDHPGGDRPLACTDGGANATGGEACGCNKDCQSGFCVDGVCCDTACDDTCKACNVQGMMGTCSFVPSGLKPRAASTCPTADVGSCGTDGTCDGQGACRKYVMGTVCKAGTCDGAALAGIQTCDGAGACQPADPKVCLPYSCDASKQNCFDSCASNTDCATGVQCVNGSCGPKMNGS